MSFKVIDGGGPDKEHREREERKRERQREREWAQSEFSWAIRDCAANMLRIIRGAGKPYELMRQMQRAIAASVKFQEVHGYWPQDVIANDLRLDDEMEKYRARVREGTIDQTTFDRWWQDGTFDRMDAKHTMYRGALQIVASQLIGQNTQEKAGESEFHNGLGAYEWAREEQLVRRRQEARVSRLQAPKKRKRNDSAAPAEAAFQPDAKKVGRETLGAGRAQQGHRSQIFGEDDLKELRKAIKAKDNKRIAELTAKLGKPTFQEPK